MTQQTICVKAFLSRVSFENNFIQTQHLFNKINKHPHLRTNTFIAKVRLRVAFKC